MRPLAFSCISCFLLLLFSIGSFGQGPQLVLVHHETNQVLHIKTGYKTFVRVRGELDEVRGKLTSISDTALVVDGQQIPLHDILALNGVHWTNSLAEAGGAVVSVGGTLWFLVGLGFFVEGATEGEPVRLIGGLLDMGIGSGITYLGLKPWIKRRKRHWLGQGWQIVVLHPPSDS